MLGRVREDYWRHRRFTFELAAPNVDYDDHQYVLYILFNPPEAQVGATVERLVDITIGRGSLYRRESVPRFHGRVGGFKIVNLFTEIQNNPEHINAEAWRSNTEDPEAWRDLCDDRNCVAICAAWGQIGPDHREVGKRRREVARWLNRNYSRKVGTLGFSRAEIPYHPISDVFMRNVRPEFRIEQIPEI